MAELRKRLTLFDLTMLVIGSSIGSGIFLTPSSIARELPSPVWMLLAWGLGGFLTVAGALTFAELGALMPRAGGVYAFLSEAYGGLVGFLYGWAYFLVVTTGAIAALAVAFATYVGFLVPLGPMETKLVAIVGIVIVSMVNIASVKLAAVFADVFTVLKLGAIGALVAFGFAFGSSHTSDFTAPLVRHDTASALSTFAAAMVGVLWSYGGWQHGTFAAGEAKDPQRHVPIAIVIGSGVVTVVYLATNVAYMFLASPTAMASSQRLAADLVSRELGHAGGSAIAAAILVSTFGTAAIYTMTAPRMYWAMAKDGAFFRSAAEIHPRFHTPARAIVLQSAWAIVLIVFWGTFENLISYVVFTDWIFFGLAGASVFVLRKKMPNARRPYRVPGYPVTPALFVAVSAWFVAQTLVKKPAQAIAGLIFLGLGVPVYRWWRREQ
jgi:APA family basic amino acid/polyamine antiporter